jgi:hypothetical protein
MGYTLSTVELGSSGVVGMDTSKESVPCKQNKQTWMGLTGYLWASHFPRLSYLNPEMWITDRFTKTQHWWDE